MTRTERTRARTTAAALALGALLGGANLHAQPAAPAELLRRIEDSARTENPAFAGFSAARGAAFFAARHGRDLACAGCHGSDPRSGGRHAITGRDIAPLAPAANPQRFTDAAKAAKWFKRNCNDVLGRACTAGEQGDVLAWLLTLRS